MLTQLLGQAAVPISKGQHCRSWLAADNVKKLFLKGQAKDKDWLRQGEEGPVVKAFSLARQNLHFPLQCSGTGSSLLSQTGRALWKYTNPLSLPLWPHILEKKKDSSRPHYPLHLPFPHLKSLQFLKLLSVICVVFILASLEICCQTIALGNSVAFFVHSVTWFLFLASTSS